MRRIFIAPALLFAVSAFGLVVALVGDGAWDHAGWLTVGLPLAVIAWFWRRRA